MKQKRDDRLILLSVDYGDVRTGIAVCDKQEMLASPVTVIQETWQPKLAAKIAELAEAHNPERIVVGQPRNMDGSYGPRAEKCAELAALLQHEYGLDTVLYDERLTTVEAHYALNLTNTRGSKRKAVVDAVSPVIILGDYMKHEHDQGETNNV